MQRILALITARGGSKGLPGKNILPLGGQPLIAWSISAAKKAPSIDRVVVSTDAPEIAEVARQYGAEVPFTRPADLAGDASPHIDVVIHALDAMQAIDGYAPDWLLLLQPTSPFRTAEDIEQSVQIAREKSAPAVVSVVETHDHPYLVRRLSNGRGLEPFVTCNIAYPRRQDLPTAYALNGAIYLCRVDRLRQERTFEPSGTVPYVMPPERSLQIDTPWDMRLCEAVLQMTPQTSQSECDDSAVQVSEK